MRLSDSDIRRFRKKSNFCVVLHFVIIQRTKSTPHDYKICTPFYPAYVWRGSLNFLRNRLYLIFYDAITFVLMIIKPETFKKCSFLFKAKEGENFNHRNT